VRLYLRIKLVVSDIDDTLLPIGQYTLSPLAMEGIRALQWEGIVFVADTDRGMGELRQFFDDSAAPSSTVRIDGQQIWLQGQLFFNRTIPLPDVQALSEALEPHNSHTYLIAFSEDYHGSIRQGGYL
jgi:hydroxymethylpyrimidine pyrophosphatase-like HAD family hydrolase